MNRATYIHPVWAGAVAVLLGSAAKLAIAQSSDLSDRSPFTMTRVSATPVELGVAPPPSGDIVWQFSPPTPGRAGTIVTDTGESYRVIQDVGVDATFAPSPPASPAAGGGAAAGGAAEENNGTNPAQNARTAIFTNSFTELSGGNEINTTYLRMKFPMFGGRGSYLVEVPFNFYDLETPIAGQIGGLGDVKFQFSYNTWSSADKRLTFINFLEMYIPSADNVLLTNVPDANQFVALDIGTGKYVLGPGVGLVYALRKNTIIAPLYFYEASVAGIDSRPDINRGKWRIFLMNSWQNGVYILPELNIVTNYFNGSTDTFIAPEVGIMRKATTVYVKPGVGVDPAPNERDWGIEFGARVMF